MRTALISTVIGALLFLLPGCGETPVYTKAFSFKNNAWTRDAKPQFIVPITDTALYYTITITLRTTTSYKYSNLWFFLHSKSPKGQTGREPIQVMIANPDGSWIGKKSGTIIENVLHYSHRKFPQKGNYVFTFELGVTQDKMPEVIDVTYAVEKDKNQQP